MTVIPITEAPTYQRGERVRKEGLYVMLGAFAIGIAIGIAEGLLDKNA